VPTRTDIEAMAVLTQKELSVTVRPIMLMIRFQRIGRKNDPAFRMAVLEKSAGPKAGKYVDLVGTYNPKTKAMTVKGDAIKDWVAKGAQLSPSLSNLLVSRGIIEGTKTARVVSKKNLEKNVAKKAEEEAKAAAASAAALHAAKEAEAIAPEAPVAEVDATPEEAVVADTTPEAVTEAEAPASEEAVPEATEEKAAP